MVQSIDRAMSIIFVLISDESKTLWSISEIAEKTSLPLSTVHRLISSLMKYGLIQQVPETKQYKVGLTWMEIGLRILDKIDVRAVARTVMEQLAADVRESVYLNIPHGHDAIVLERVESSMTVRSIDNLGERIPLHIGAANKTILANMEPQEAERIVAALIPEPERRRELLLLLPQIRQNGYAVSYGEKTEGTASIAAPIIGYNQRVVGALSIGVPSYRITDELLSTLIERARQSAKEISHKIGALP
ncbi:IclR family transcriptional regulator [Brevibacillus agri]|uniref:IclR family transcriptional regulator n=1 Tax=Brevibacillus agri TaxID=51101 RepID=A0A3M8ASQ0_9BACL|nr:MULTISPECIES: IclR family transcriptional regulator [Bacillota]ELK43561.1 transcriptional regulator [Brevibacillus agri BAB-2500]EJL47284.1 transcriptional regulator [Brevibacillus sp. CF112]MBG9567422.1 ABC transporter permease [Brevibacillus agri]MBY0052627.1 IclR family transcriptional regulator [Brevibacillus agri]MCG5250965.1 IclR family transcriptional regulator [Brevibacillus agri]